MTGLSTQPMSSARELQQPASNTMFARTMMFVALTAGLFALGAYLGRNLSGEVGIIAFVGSFALLLGMNFAVNSSTGLTIVLLAGFGLLTGVATAPTLVHYASADPAAVWQSAVATGLFVAAFGAAGYATRRDLAALARIAFWALLGLIVSGIVLVFAQIPHGALIYAVLGLVTFAALTMFDFQRLRRPDEIESAPLLAASIFLDILTVLLLVLEFAFGGHVSDSD